MSASSQPELSTKRHPSIRGKGGRGFISNLFFPLTIQVFLLYTLAIFLIVEISQSSVSHFVVSKSSLHLVDRHENKHKSNERRLSRLSGQARVGLRHYYS